MLVLLSGGVDSTALVDYYLCRDYKVYGLHFQYGQLSGEAEKKAAIDIANYYKIELNIEKIGFEMKRKNYEILCRNALFILAAATLLPQDVKTISIGIHSGSAYYDASIDFINDCQRIVDGYFGGTVIIDAPFIEFSKNHIYEYCALRDVPIHLTYSCENSNSIACGFCPSCLDRRFLIEQLEKVDKNTCH